MANSIRSPQLSAAPASPAQSLLRFGLGVALALALVAAVFWRTFVLLAEFWNVDPNYSHGWLVPLASLFFAYQARQSGKSLPAELVSPVVAVKGALRAALGLAMHFPAALFGNLLLDTIALILVLQGLLIALGGMSLYREYRFATLFLIFMAPLPLAWYKPLALFLQELVSRISAWILELFGIAVYREGYFIRIPGFFMEVGEACSGLRQLTAILALSVALGKLSGRGLRYRMVLALLALPIALLANCIRVVLTGVIMMLFGLKWAEGVWHTLEGMAIVVLAAVLFVGVAWLLARLEDQARRPGRESTT